MDYRPLGPTGVTVSRLALGTMTWGQGSTVEDATAALRAFRDAGGTLVDTADSYADGESERMLGKVLDGAVARAEIFLASKAGCLPSKPGHAADRRRTDTSRRHLLAALDASLARLGTDHLDLWQLDAFDPQTPLEESLATCDAAIASGRARYAGVANFNGWQTAAAASRQAGWPGRPRLAGTQVRYSLLERGVEREVLPAAAAFGLAVLAAAPLGHGVLTGKYRGGTPADSRGATASLAGSVQAYLDERAAGIVGAVRTAADGLGVSPVAVALCWVRDRPGVTSAIVGARTLSQLRASLDAERLTLPAEIRSALDEVSAPPLGYPEVRPS